MIVCICHRVSDRDIAREATSGCASFEELQDDLRVGTGCGACLDYAQATFSQHRSGACGPCHAWPAQGHREHCAPVHLSTNLAAALATPSRALAAAKGHTSCA